jgi:hypothetical protein
MNLSKNPNILLAQVLITVHTNTIIKSMYICAVQRVGTWQATHQVTPEFAEKRK